MSTIDKTTSGSSGDFYYLGCNSTGGCGTSQIVCIPNRVFVIPAGWELINELKKGGMATVFLCPVCVKDAERCISNGFKECTRCQNKTSVATLCSKCTRNAALAKKRRYKIESSVIIGGPNGG